jgi:hypothetical protein
MPPQNARLAILHIIDKEHQAKRVFCRGAEEGHDRDIGCRSIVSLIEVYRLVDAPSRQVPPG